MGEEQRLERIDATLTKLVNDVGELKGTRAIVERVSEQIEQHLADHRRAGGSLRDWLMFIVAVAAVAVAIWK